VQNLSCLYKLINGAVHHEKDVNKKNYENRWD
jgi:hypothetical protein